MYKYGMTISINKISITVRLAKEIYLCLKIEAARNKHSINKHIVLVLTRYVKTTKAYQDLQNKKADQ